MTSSTVSMLLLSQDLRPLFHLLWVVLLEWQEGGDVEHNLDAPPVGEHGVGPGQVVDRVQPALVAVETCRRERQTDRPCRAEFVPTSCISSQIRDMVRCSCRVQSPSSKLDKHRLD